MFIHLDPRRPDVVVPKWFMGQPQLVLQVGLNMAIPIPDLKIDDDGHHLHALVQPRAVLVPHPVDAVYALVGEDGRGGVWPDDVPPEIEQQMPEAAGQAAPGEAAEGAAGGQAAARRRGRRGDDEAAEAKPTRQRPRPGRPRRPPASPRPRRRARARSGASRGPRRSRRRDERRARGAGRVRRAAPAAGRLERQEAEARDPALAAASIK